MFFFKFFVISYYCETLFHNSLEIHNAKSYVCLIIHMYKMKLNIYLLPTTCLYFNVKFDFKAIHYIYIYIVSMYNEYDHLNLDAWPLHA